MRRPVLLCLVFFFGLAVLAPEAALAKAKPTNSAAEQLSFGVKMARRELWNEALFRFRQAARLDPDNPRIVNNLAVACEATGAFDEALKYYKDALRLSPTDRTVKGNYARFVEFYESLKPPEDKAKGEVPQAAGTAAAPPTGAS
jgi:Flp pilus assembly protein TadD